MKNLVIEYVCWGNIVRSSTYEAVTQHFAEISDLAVKPVSSGLYVEQWNRKQFTKSDIDFYLNEMLKLERILSHVEAYKEIFAEAKQAFTHKDHVPRERLEKIASRGRKMFEGYNARMRQEALLLRGVEFFGYPKQTLPRDDVDVIIPMAEKDVPAVAAIYRQRLIVPVSNFGKEPAGFGYLLEEHLANVDLAFEQVPEIIQSFLNRKIY